MQNQQSNPAQSAQARPTAISSEIVQLAGAALIGAFVVYGVGFSHLMPMHNAAHDTRHSATFPCH